MVDLDDWSIVGEHQTLYSAPHQQLHGRRPDGKYIWTSRIKTINGNEVTTLSGAIYKLLTPHTQITFNGVLIIIITSQQKQNRSS